MEEKMFLSFDIGGSYIKYALIDINGEVELKGKEETPKKSLEDFLEIIYKKIEEFYSIVDGISFSSPGKIDTKNGIIYFGGALPYLHGLEIKNIIEQKYGLPSFVQNDGKAAAQAELWRGKLQDVKDGAVIVLGTGVGGGIVLDGKLRVGPHFQTGELSLSMLNSGAENPMDRMTGGVCSAVRLVTSINKVCGNELNDGIKAFEEVKNGNEKAVEIFTEYCRNVTYLIVNMQMLFDLTTYVISGGISEQDILIDEIRNQFNKFRTSNSLIEMNLPEITIEKASFGNEANLYGALYGLLIQEGLI